MGVQRYHIISDGEDCFKHPKGEWVKFEDHQREMKLLDRSLESNSDSYKDGYEAGSKAGKKKHETR